MTTTLNASTAGAGGFIATSDNSGVLALQTAGTTAITVDTSQNTTFAKSIILSGSTSGTTTLASTAVAGTSTATFPAATGTVMLNGPTFSILGTASVSFSSATATKVPYGSSTQWDTASCYSTANHRFTPNVAGYYQVNANAAFDATSGTVGLCWVYKNGTLFKRGNQISLAVGNFGTLEPTVSAIVYCNGTTDYLEIYAYCAGTSPNFNGDRWFDASLIRGT